MGKAARGVDILNQYLAIDGGHPVRWWEMGAGEGLPRETSGMPQASRDGGGCLAHGFAQRR